MIVKTAADKDLSNYLKSIMLVLGFILGKMKKSPDAAIVEKCWKNFAIFPLLSQHQVKSFKC